MMFLKQLLPIFLMMIAATTTAQLVAANELASSKENNSPPVENEAILSEDLVNHQILSGTGEGETVNLAEVFTAHIEEIRQKLPSDWVMRLPSQILFNKAVNGEAIDYTIKVISSNSPSSLTINLYHCDDNLPSCLAGHFSVHSKSSLTAQEALQRHQAAVTPITLAKGIQGYLLEKQQDLSPTLSSVMWEQDELIYTASFLSEERQNLLYMAHSMANATPIEALQIPVRDENLPSLEAEVVEDFDLELENKDRKFSVKFNEYSISSANNNYFTSAEYLLTEENESHVEKNESHVNDAETPPFPLPKGLEIDESGGQFPLGVIRPIPILELNFNSSVFTNSNLLSTTNSSPNDPIGTDSTVFLNGVTFRASPELGPNTRLAADIGGTFAHFTTGDNYTLFNTNLGILQELGDRMSLGFGWGYRQIYTSLNRDLSEHSVRLTWNRINQLDRSLFLNLNYQLSASFAQFDPQIPFDRPNRLTNSAELSLNYSFTPKFQGLLGYRLSYDNFFNNSTVSDVVQHLLGLQLTYQINRNIFIGSSFSYVFGEAVDLVNPSPGSQTLNNLSFGFSFGFNFPLLY